MNSQTKPILEEQKIQEPLPNNHRAKALWWLTGIIVLLGLGWFLVWDLIFRFEQYTDDAYANGNMIHINSAISGSVTAFYADDTDLVKQGQLLIQLDEIPYKITYEKELSILASIVLQVRQLYDNVLLNKANVESKRIELEKNRYDYENRRQLVSSSAISNEDFVHAQDAYYLAQINLEQAKSQLQLALDAAGNTPIENHPLIEQQKKNIFTAYYNWRHCSIYAPATGYIAQRNVNVGEWAIPPKALMAIIPTDYVWVDANFKETQMTYMRIGQPAEIWFDMYGSKVKFTGKVLGMASGTGSVFSLIPPQNATGNWIKIVQRLPVRISLDPEKLKEYPMRLGITAEVKVDITNRDLPLLAQIPPEKPVGTTPVFNIDMKEVESLIDEIIQSNLRTKVL